MVGSIPPRIVQRLLLMGVTGWTTVGDKLVIFLPHEMEDEDLKRLSSFIASSIGVSEGKIEYVVTGRFRALGCGG